MIVDSQSVTDRVEKCIDFCRQGAALLRSTAIDTDNMQARNAFVSAAEKIESGIQQCKGALNQLQ